MTVVSDCRCPSCFCVDLRDQCVSIASIAGQLLLFFFIKADAAVWALLFSAPLQHPIQRPEVVNVYNPWKLRASVCAIGIKDL